MNEYQAFFFRLKEDGITPEVFGNSFQLIAEDLDAAETQALELARPNEAAGVKLQHEKLVRRTVWFEPTATRA